MQERGYLMWKFADLIEKEAHNLAIIETLVNPCAFIITPNK